MARSVRVSLGFTQNLGNFETLRTGIEYEEDISVDKYGNTSGRKDLVEELEVRPGEDHDAIVDELYDRLSGKLTIIAKQFHDEMSGDARRKTKIRPQ